MNKGGTTGEYILVLDFKDGDFLRAGKECQLPQNKADGCLHPERLICGHMSWIIKFYAHKKQEEK